MPISPLGNRAGAFVKLVMSSTFINFNLQPKEAGLSAPDHTLKDKSADYGAIRKCFESLVRTTMERFPVVPKMPSYNASLDYNYQMLKVLAGRHFISRMKRLERDFLTHELELARGRDIDWRSFSRRLRGELEGQIHDVRQIEREQKLSHFYFERARLAMEQNEEKHLKEWLHSIEERAFWIHREDEKYRKKIIQDDQIIKNLEEDRRFVRSRPINVASMNITGVLNELPWASAGKVLFAMESAKTNQLRLHADVLAEHGHAGLPAEALFSAYKFNKAAWIRLTQKIKAEDRHFIQVKNLRRHLEDTFLEKNREYKELKTNQKDIVKDYWNAWDKENKAAPISISFNALTAQRGLQLLNKTDDTGALLRFMSNTKKMALVAHAEQIMEHISHNIPLEVWGSFSIAPEWHSETKYTNTRTIKDKKRRLEKEDRFLDRHVIAEFERDRLRNLNWSVKAEIRHENLEKIKADKNQGHFHNLLRAKSLNRDNPQAFVNDDSTRVNPENGAMHRNLVGSANAFQMKNITHFSFVKPDGKSPNFSLRDFLSHRTNQSQVEDFHIRNNPDVKSAISAYNARVNPQAGADELFNAKYLSDSKLKVDDSTFMEKNIVSERAVTDLGRTPYKLVQPERTGWVEETQGTLKRRDKKSS